MAINLEEAHIEFAQLKTQAVSRNQEYYLSRQAVQGNFRWPRQWPAHIEKITHNLVKPITERFSTYLMGREFSYNIDRPNTLEFRDKAERTEKILRRLLTLSNSQLQFDAGAKSGSQLGRTIFKVYEKGDKGNKHACFSYCQPDYFFGVPSGDNLLGEYSAVYYSYPLDINEAKRLFGNAEYKTEDQLSNSNYYQPLQEDERRDSQGRKSRRVPVLESWTRNDYSLEVGGKVVYNGDNPFKDKTTGEGYIPFIVIENIRNAGTGYGESDIVQARELNEQLNYLLSRKVHIVGRWLQPTLVWEGAPQNYAETLAATIGGGGAIPTRLGSRLYFLAYDRPNPAVTEMEHTLRQAILDTTGMSEVALQGTPHGSINTGPALQAQMAPVLLTIEKKRKEWERGIKTLFRMLLDTQERIGDSKALGSAVVNQTVKSNSGTDGELVELSGKDIDGLRDITLLWPEVMPKDSVTSAQFELTKHGQGVQSFYTTLEKLGEEFPDDEIARIRMENMDPSLRGEKVAEQMKAQAALGKTMLGQTQQQFDQQQAMAAQQPQQPSPSPMTSAPDMQAQGNVNIPPGTSDKIRSLIRNRQAQVDTTGDSPIINK